MKIGSVGRQAITRGVRSGLAALALATLPLGGSAMLRPALAEPVAVNRGSGQGLIFSHRGNCYLILPQHVHERRRRVSLVTAQPATVGEADIFRSFSPGMDLSIGLVRPGMERRCTDDWSDLPSRTDALLDATDIATLVRLSATGQEQRIPIRIVARDLETLRGTPRDGVSEIFQGTSGAMLRIDGTVVGMAVQSRDVGEVTFLRIDEIKARLERLLEARTAAAPDIAEASNPEASAGGCVAGAIPIHSVVCSREPLAAEYGCANLAAGDGIVVLPPGYVEVTLELDVERAVPLSEVILSSTPVEGQAAAPKSVRVEVDSSSSGARRWRSYGAGDMTPFGALDLENGAKPYARRIRLTLESSWDAALPTTLDCVAVR